MAELRSGVDLDVGQAPEQKAIPVKIRDNTEVQTFTEWLEARGVNQEIDYPDSIVHTALRAFLADIASGEIRKLRKVQVRQ